ncbi:MAG: molybdopterin cofactor-binding domain-containing protein, partial [Myxococcota bacterium]
MASQTRDPLLIAAAAQTWQVSPSALSVDRGVISHQSSGRSATFGELASTAATLPLPDQVELKDPGDFKLIGSDPGRVDVSPKTDGSAVFTLDVYLPDMLTALIARPPRFGSKVASVSSTAARSIPGVVDVVEVPAGVAVVAEGFWAARRGREALSIEWDDSQAETRSSAELFAEYRQLAEQPGDIAQNDGDAEAAIIGASQIVEAEYELPYLAHAPMETLDCVIRASGDRAEVWAGAQIPTVDQYFVAEVLGIPRDQVTINTMLAGGSFGRRSTNMYDVTAETASIVKEMGDDRPIKLVWTREDDIRGGFYRPMYVHRLRAGLDARGEIVGWHHRLVGQSVLRGTVFEAILGGNTDVSSAEGASHLPYSVPNILVDVHTTEVGAPVRWWRSVGHSHNAFAVEVFLDELASAAGRDPFELRRSLLSGHPRLRAALELAADRADWGSPLPAGVARGIAVHESFGTMVAQVAEVRLGGDGTPIVDRVVCAVDCGVAINPDNIRAQMEGGIG